MDYLNQKMLTKDAEEAAFMWTRNDSFELSEVTVSKGYNKNIVWFHFNLKRTIDEIKQILNEYHNGQSLIEPRKYARMRNKIRKIIHGKQTFHNNAEA